MCALPFLTSAHASACANYLPAYLTAHESFHCFSTSSIRTNSPTYSHAYTPTTHERFHCSPRAHLSTVLAVASTTHKLLLSPRTLPIHTSYTRAPPLLTYTSTTCTHAHFHCFTREISPLASSCSYFQLYESTSTRPHRMSATIFYARALVTSASA